MNLIKLLDEVERESNFDYHGEREQVKEWLRNWAIKHITKLEEDRSVVDYIGHDHWEPTILDRIISDWKRMFNVKDSEIKINLKNVNRRRKKELKKLEERT